MMGRGVGWRFLDDVWVEWDLHFFGVDFSRETRDSFVAGSALAAHLVVGVGGAGEVGARERSGLELASGERAELGGEVLGAGRGAPGGLVAAEEDLLVGHAGLGSAADGLNALAEDFENFFAVLGVGVGPVDGGADAVEGVDVDVHVVGGEAEDVAVVNGLAQREGGVRQIF